MNPSCLVLHARSYGYKQFELMEINDQLNQNSGNGIENENTTKKMKKTIDGNEKKKILKLVQPNILPGKLRTESHTAVWGSSPVVVEDEQLPEIETVGMENEDEETNIETAMPNFADLSKEQLVNMMEEIVKDQDVNKIKDKVIAINIQYNQLKKDEHDKQVEKELQDQGEGQDAPADDTKDSLDERYAAAFAVYKENVENQKAENLEKKKALLENLRVLVDSEESLKKIYDEFNSIRKQWSEIGAVPASDNKDLWNNYHFLTDKLFDKVKISRELRDLDMKKNLEAKLALCEKAEELLTEKSLTKSFKSLQKYHEEWKEIGPVPQDKKEELWNRFKSATDKINKIRREYYAKLQEDQAENYATKTALCEKAEELISEELNSVNAWQKKSDELSELLKVWKTVGSASLKQNEELWARFKQSMDTFFAKKKVFFDALKDQQTENFNRKVQLCVEAESLQESTEWKKATEQLKKLQEEWKTIGPVPKKRSEKVWKRFRAACDAFFTRKSEHFSGIKGEEEANLKAKQELIGEMNAFEIKADRAENIEAIKAFQRRWFEIGHVPSKAKDAVNAEYKKAVDALFDKMKINENEISTSEYKEMVAGLKDSPESRDKIRRERNAMTTRIQKLRDEISTLENNIGFFANSKQSEVLIAEYEKKISRAKNDLKVLEAKLRILND